MAPPGGLEDKKIRRMVPTGEAKNMDFCTRFLLPIITTGNYASTMKLRTRTLAIVLTAALAVTIPNTSQAKLKPTGIVGQTVADGEMSVQVRKVQCGLKQIGTGYFVEKALGQFCVITFAMTPSKKKPVSYFSSSQKAITKAGFQAESKSILSDEYKSMLDVNPGTSVLLKVAFDVGPKDPIVIAEFHDSMFSGGVQVDLTKGSYKGK
jgi:hypothetical protein